MTICYLGIGSNLGNREANIKQAVQEIKSLEGTKVIKISRLIQTNPVGGPKGQNKYLNAAVKINTSIPALKLLRNLKNIEKKLGRRKTRRFAARPIDLDILFYGDKIINRAELKIPHPRAFKRSFVLKPLIQVL